MEKVTAFLRILKSSGRLLSPIKSLNDTVTPNELLNHILVFLINVDIDI